MNPKMGTIALWLSVGMSGTGAILAYQAAQTETVPAANVQTFVYAFGLSALFALSSLLFRKAEAEKAKEET